MVPGAGLPPEKQLVFKKTTEKEMKPGGKLLLLHDHNKRDRQTPFPSSMSSISAPKKTPMAHGSWPSPISSRRATADSLTLSRCTPSPLIAGGGNKAFWLEGRPSEKGRVVLVCAERRGGEWTAPVDVIPAPFNVRTRVCEYGGKRRGLCI